MSTAAGIASMPNDSAREPAAFAWPYVLGIALEHRRELVIAHVVAILAALLSVPIPLLMPLLMRLVKKLKQVLLQKQNYK